ncbi:hypothetical protein G4V62_03240 [Bacillaceae bacterium SIJ1]|uniref:AimR family lysis-lysogeny pheromone receptor n=1 Tax=Litoribacterium kuwaitense TaxID=1398745 RepID=UPI0013EADB9D|nr:AimR family lysis-lysogeny pheromone receptor [Litoribacterium kuwaitense]NGP44010.1 hypothetical protein [Litoribacterium kuwaitense]
MRLLKDAIRQQIQMNTEIIHRLTPLLQSKDEQELIRFIEEPLQELDDFHGLLKIIRALFPEKEREYMEDYCRHLDPNENAARMALEYSNVHRFYDLQRYLLKRLSVASSETSKEWSALYAIALEVSLRKIPGMLAIEKMYSLNLKTYQMKAFREVIQIIVYNRERLIKYVIQLSSLENKYINELEEGYLKQSYVSRLGLIYTGIYTHLSLLKEARELGTKTLKTTYQLPLICFLHMHIGNTYIISDVDKALHHFNTVLSYEHNKVINEHFIAEVKRSHNFASNLSFKPPLYLNFSNDHVSDIHEVAFYYARNNQKDKSIHILNSMDQTKLNDMQKGFHYYYRGLVLEDKEMFYESILHFNFAGDSYFKKISINELKALGESKALIRVLSN